MSARNQPQPTGVLIKTVKEMALALGYHEQFVTDMKRGGFKLPATVEEAVEFIRRHTPITRFRLYSHQNKTQKAPESSGKLRKAP